MFLYNIYRNIIRQSINYSDIRKITCLTPLTFHAFLASFKGEVSVGSEAAAEQCDLSICFLQRRPSNALVRRQSSAMKRHSGRRTNVNRHSLSRFPGFSWIARLYVILPLPNSRSFHVVDSRCNHFRRWSLRALRS